MTSPYSPIRVAAGWTGPRRCLPSSRCIRSTAFLLWEGSFEADYGVKIADTTVASAMSRAWRKGAFMIREASPPVTAKADSSMM